MNITINQELQAYIDPLTPDEHAALERSLLAEGCRDALVLWGDLLIDGHNRYGICQQHGIAFHTVQNESFKSMDDVHLWMIDNHLGRRSVSDFQRGVLALRKKEILSARAVQKSSDTSDVEAGSEVDSKAAAQAPEQPTLTRDVIAKAARVSPVTLSQIEKIQKAAAPELVSAVKAGIVSINAAAAISSLPSDKQKEAVAGGKKELRQAAREIREAKLPRKLNPKAEQEPPPADASPDQITIHKLNLVIAELNEERDQLKKKVQHLTIALAEARSAQ